MNSASLCSLAGRYDNPIPTRFLAPIDCLKIPALSPNTWIGKKGTSETALVKGIMSRDEYYNNKLELYVHALMVFTIICNSADEKIILKVLTCFFEITLKIDFENTSSQPLHRPESGDFDWKLIQEAACDSVKS